MQVRWRTIWDYVNSGGLGAFAVVAVGLLFFVLSQMATNIWLSSWSNDPVVNGTRDREHEYMRLGTYAGFGVLQRKRHGNHHTGGTFAVGLILWIIVLQRSA